MNDIPTPRIYTRCPSCHNGTLSIHNGHLFCTWVGCKDPTLIHRDNELATALAKLAETEKERYDLATLCRDIAAGNRALRAEIERKDAALRAIRAKLQTRLPNEGGWANQCPFCGKIVEHGALEHSDDCVIVLASSLSANAPKVPTIKYPPCPKCKGNDKVRTANYFEKAAFTCNRCSLDFEDTPEGVAVKDPLSNSFCVWCYSDKHTMDQCDEYSKMCEDPDGYDNTEQKRRQAEADKRLQKLAGNKPDPTQPWREVVEELRNLKERLPSSDYNIIQFDGSAHCAIAPELFDQLHISLYSAISRAEALLRKEEVKG